MVTNAYTMSPEAAQLAVAHGIQFVCVTMPLDWTQQQRWHLSDDALDECVV